MTDTEAGVDTQAQRIAERGRDALVQRLRSAYGDAAAAHADLISLDDERIEAMVQSAADRADGLQWRRALADVAAGELGVSPTEALSHPAVTRAQGLVGAPSYEESLAELIARPVPPPIRAPAPVPSSREAEPPAEPADSEPDVIHAANSEATVFDAASEPDTFDGEDAQRNGFEAADPDLAESEEDGFAHAEPEEGEPEQAEAEQAEAEQTEAEQTEAEPAGFAPRSVSDVDSELPPTTEHQWAVQIAKSWPNQPLGAPPNLAPGREAPASSRAPEPEELETVEADDQVVELLPEPDPGEYATEAYDVEASFANEEASFANEDNAAAIAPEPAAAAATDARHEEASGPADQGGLDDNSAENGRFDAAAPGADPEPQVAMPLPRQEDPDVVIPAIHLGGVANLPTKRPGLSVRLSADGLDILQGDREILGRLIWDEIEALEVPHLRVRRRSKQTRARLVVRTPYGDASFEVPEISGDELRDRVEPMMRIYGGS